MSLTEGGSFNDKVNFIWSVADLLRGDYRPSEYGRVMLPFVVLRRFDCVLADTKPDVLEAAPKLAHLDKPEKALSAVAGQEFYNTSPLDLAKITADPDNVFGALRSYIGAFSPSAAEVLEKFRFDEQLQRLADADLLYQVVSKFADIDLHPSVVGNHEMGYIYEELIRRFSEQSNETAGEHFTPREVIRLMVNLLFVEDDAALTDSAVVKTLFDPACGTGGMLAVAEEHLRELNPNAHLEVYGQELNDESYAICRSDMMLKGHSAQNIAAGNSFSRDAFAGETFDYMLANPPFGVEWKKVQQTIVDEHKHLGFEGRFGAGLPRVNDGSLLFLQHMISKMKPVNADGTGGSRIAIVFNGSPLFTGAAGSGESEIRRWIIENDWLEAVVALPDQLFYNTGISTYFWVVTNRKHPERRGKVQLVDARDQFVKMRKALGEKRKEISPAQIAEITRLYGDFTEGEQVKIFPNEDFGFQRITVERPLRIRFDVTDDTIANLDASKAFAKLPAETQAEVSAGLRAMLNGRATSFDDRIDAGLTFAKCVAETRDPGVTVDFPYKAGLLAAELGVTRAVEKQLLDALIVRDPAAAPVADRHGNPEPDPELRDNENVPLPPGTPIWDPHDEGAAKRLADDAHRQVVDDYVAAEVHPWVPDAWVDYSKTKIGYEIPLTRLFYRYEPPRPVSEIDAELDCLEDRVQELLAEVRR